MEKTDKKKPAKGIIIGIVIVVVGIVAALVFYFINRGGQEEYRIIKVYEIEGKVTVTRESKGEMEAYTNMVLKSGDVVKVSEGTATLKLDDDKYVYAEKDTEFEIVATGTAADSKTSINLKKGTILNDIQNKLSDDSSYEVNTPNSSMMVRGTLYIAKVELTEEGYVSEVKVLEGTVEMDLINENGERLDEVVKVEAGMEIAASQDAKSNEYVQKQPVKLDYNDISPSMAKAVVSAIDRGKNIDEDIQTKLEIIIEKGHYEELDTEESTEAIICEVLFYYNDTLFATQVIEYGEKAVEPTLMPTPTGKWDFDFDDVITEDTIINWKE